ncbi:unnamed protein product [Parajaminaea phylloscopi]
MLDPFTGITIHRRRIPFSHPLYTHNPTHAHKMPVGTIPQITGKLRKRLILDLSVALGGGTAAGYAFWYGVHLPANQRRDDFYAKLQAQKAQASSE